MKLQTAAVYKRHGPQYPLSPLSRLAWDKNLLSLQWSAFICNVLVKSRNLIYVVFLCKTSLIAKIIHIKFLNWKYYSFSEHVLRLTLIHILKWYKIIQSVIALFPKPILENQYSNDSIFDREELYIDWNIVIILVILHDLKSYWQIKIFTISKMGISY